MGVSATYTCDRCGEEHKHDPTKAQELYIPMRLVGIIISPVWADRHRYIKPVIHHEQTWCRKCVGQFNLDGLILKAEEDVKKFTLEDYIKEIVTHTIKESE